jgi:anti-sigma factor RsiW
MRLLRDTCRSIRDLLPLHVGGDLDAGPARRVDEHLHRCLSCFRDFRDLAAMRQRLVVLGEQQPPAAGLEHFTEEVMARIALGERGPAAELPGVRRSRPAVMLPLAAAATLLVGVALGFVARAGQPQASPLRGPTLAGPAVAGPAAGGTALGPVLAPAPVVSRIESPVPAEPRATPVRDLAGYWLSPEESALLDTTLLRNPDLIRSYLNGPHEGLRPEPGRQLRPRDPVPPQDG